MKAGRELDALVHERVMGYTLPELLPPYSTDIAYAWLVVEKMGKQRSVFYMEVRNTIGGDLRVRLSYTDTVMLGTENEWGEVEREGEVIASTLPLAICLAALKAVGATV